MFPNTTKILIVDDMLTVRKLLTKSLKDLGFTDISDAPDGEAAWQKISDASETPSKFELIISDWNMPKMSGIDLLKKVRSCKATQSTPFVMLTAQFDRDEVVEALKAGLSSYINKPFSLAILSEKLQALWVHISATHSGGSRGT